LPIPALYRPERLETEDREFDMSIYARDGQLVGEKKTVKFRVRTDSDAPLLPVFLAHPLPLLALLAHPLHHLLGLRRGHDRPPLLDEPSDDPQDRESRPEGPVH
jgi:hypothetical protein